MTDPKPTTPGSPDEAVKLPQGPKQRKFCQIGPNYRGALHGLVFVNEEKLRAPPNFGIIRPEEGGFPPLAEQPLIIAGKPIPCPVRI